MAAFDIASEGRHGGLAPRLGRCRPNLTPTCRHGLVVEGSAGDLEIAAGGPGVQDRRENHQQTGMPLAFLGPMVYNVVDKDGSWLVRERSCMRIDWNRFNVITIQLS